MKTTTTRAMVETAIRTLDNADAARKAAMRLGNTKAASVLHAHASMLAAGSDEATVLYFAGRREAMLDAFFPR